jgi:hypothetical protein
VISRALHLLTMWIGSVAILLGGSPARPIQPIQDNQRRPRSNERKEAYKDPVSLQGGTSSVFFRMHPDVRRDLARFCAQAGCIVRSARSASERTSSFLIGGR